MLSSERKKSRRSVYLYVCTLHRSNGRVGWFKLPLSFLRPHSDGRECTEWRDILPLDM